MNNRGLNFIWIMIDSVRRYHTDGDDRSRLPYMDEFAKDSVEFLNCLTSAPSTLMSISASLTGLPSYYLAQNYKDFQFNTDYFETFNSVLKKNKYETARAVIMHPEVRIKLKQFDILPKKYWPSGYKHIDWFNNTMVYNIIENALTYGEVRNCEKPSFWFVDYNCRNDRNISKRVQETVELFNKNGFTNENTVFLISSDHGYPDPQTGITPAYLKSQALTHDVFMTDDNIMIPYLLKYPGCPKGMKIKELVTTLDLFPTLVELLELKVSDSQDFLGESLLNKTEDEWQINRRLGRCDARWQGQPNRLTAIRSDQFKLVHNHDKRETRLYDISKNDNRPEEIEIPRATNKAAFERLYDEFLETERTAEIQQIDFFLFKWSDYFERLPKGYKITIKMDNPEIGKILSNKIPYESKKNSPKTVFIVQYRSDIPFLKRCFNRVIPFSSNYRDDKKIHLKLLIRLDELIKSFKFSKVFIREEPTLLISYPFFIFRRMIGYGKEMPPYSK